MLLTLLMIKAVYIYIHMYYFLAVYGGIWCTIKKISVKPNMHNPMDESINLQNSKRGQPNPALLIVKIPKSLVPVRVASPGRFVHTLPAPQKRANLQGGWTDHRSAFAKKLLASRCLRDGYIFFRRKMGKTPSRQATGRIPMGNDWMGSHSCHMCQALVGKTIK